MKLSPLFITHPPPYRANLFNSFVLIVVGMWGFWAQPGASSTSFIPVGFGALFAVSSFPLRKENRLVLLILSILTGLLIVALALLLWREWAAANHWAVLRLGLMGATSIFTLWVFFRQRGEVRPAEG